MNNYPKYDPSKTCVKCGDAHASTTFERLDGVERMRRVCARCGYDWFESPFDASIEQPIEYKHALSGDLIISLTEDYESLARAATCKYQAMRVALKRVGIQVDVNV